MKTLIVFLMMVGVAWGQDFSAIATADNIDTAGISDSSIDVNERKQYNWKVGKKYSTQFGVECDNSDNNCISRSEVSAILKAALRYVLFSSRESYLNSLEPVEGIEVQMIEAIKCLEMTDAGCKFIQ